MSAVLTLPAVLRFAAEILEPPGAWAQGYYGFDANGDRADWADPQGAVCLCVVGALRRAAGGKLDIADAAEDVLIRVLPPPPGPHESPAVYWNDTPGRTQAEVVAALRKAADLAEAA